MCVNIQTGNGILFRLFKSVLIERSGVFATMFAPPKLPVSGEVSATAPIGGDGCADDNPIMLTHIGSEKFEALIEFFHPKYILLESNGKIKR